MEQPFLAIVNPAAGGGKSRTLLGPALERLRSAGLEVKVALTRAPGDATQMAHDAYQRGVRNFIAVGGDGTSYEIINGLYPQAASAEPPALGFLPLGTGNSFLRDFSERGVEHAIESLIAQRRHPCDVLRLRHRSGVIHYINLLSMGFSADVATLRARSFSSWGEFGYFASIFLTLARFRRRPFPVRVLGEQQPAETQPEAQFRDRPFDDRPFDDRPFGDRPFDDRPCLFLTFSNSKFTGGTMMIAPKADISDGLIEYVRWGPIGRLGLIRNLPGLYDGTHIRHRLAECKSVRGVEFNLDAPVDVMVDGEVLSLHCQQLDVLAAALNVIA